MKFIQQIACLLFRKKRGTDLFDRDKRCYILTRAVVQMISVIQILFTIFSLFCVCVQPSIHSVLQITNIL